MTARKSPPKPATLSWAAVGKLRPGTKLPGGVFTGIVYEGKKAYALVTGPESDKQLTFDEAQAWANSLGVGKLSDFTVSSQLHQAMQYTYLRKLFRAEYYWSCEQHASLSDCAWTQGFTDGGQGTWSKDFKFPARAVRRIPIR